MYNYVYTKCMYTAMFCIYMYGGKRDLVTHPREARCLAAGDVLDMEPAGLMWSVVTLSPKLSSTAAFSILHTAGGSFVYTDRTTF